MGRSQEFMVRKIGEVYTPEYARTLTNPKQVKAIYISLKNRGKIARPSKRKGQVEYSQMTIADFMQSHEYDPR